MTAEARALEHHDPSLHPGVDIALEGVDAGIVEFLLVGLALGRLAEVEDVRAGRLAGAVDRPWRGYCGGWGRR